MSGEQKISEVLSEDKNEVPRETILAGFVKDLTILKLAPDEVLLIRVPQDLMESPESVFGMRDAICSILKTDRILIVSEDIKFEKMKVEAAQKFLEETMAQFICEHCGGSGRDEAGKDCVWCKPWVPSGGAFPRAHQ